MIRIVPSILAVFGIGLASSLALGHGTPIRVGQTAGTLTISDGHSDSEGFAPWLFFETDDDGDPQGAFTLPGVGPIVHWQVPGLHIEGLAESASLSLEVLSRPVLDSSPPEKRVVWHWDPGSMEVLPSSADIHFLGTGARFATLDAASAEAPASFLLASSMTDQQGFHNHQLLSYGLENSAPRPAGAYGFFARLSSDQYAASAPFLILFNDRMDYELMAEAALAINAAAVDSLLGDFNEDGFVNAADYVIARKWALPAEDLAMWFENFGASGGGSSDEHTLTSVPEPSTLLLCCLWSGMLNLWARRRR